jgi:hypothetical protein
MQTLGIRTSSKCVRYAVIQWEGEVATLVNATEESKLNFPAAMENTADRLGWLKNELERIFSTFPAINHVAIKTNEFLREKLPNRISTQLDGGVLLVSNLNGKPCSTRLYTQIAKGMSSKKVKGFSEENVGRSSMYWDNQMADAIAVAWTRKDQP